MTIPEPVIQASISDVLETMYFISPTYSGEALPAAAALGVEVTFTGEKRGCFYVYVAPDLARRMTSDFLACDPEELEHEQIASAVMELANVACGCSMSAWMPGVNFEYGVPRLSPPPTTPVAHSFAVTTERPEIFFSAVCEG